MPTLQLLPLEDTLVGGKYQLGEVIGSGGVGTVYRATHLWTEREVAVKVLDPCLPHFDQLREAFLREARATVQLQHPHVVDVLDMGEDEAGTTYMVMELLDGPTLRDILVERGPLSAEDTAAILLPLIGALEKAHELGIVHKDFKPENIILSVDSSNVLTPKLLDFGVAQMVRESRPKPFTVAKNIIIGTPQYMAPEQARDQRHLIGPQTDVWGVGVVWYECLTGQSPFQAETPAEVLKAVCEAPIDFKGIPDDIAQVLQWALERSVSKRIPSLWILRAELHRASVFAGSTEAFRSLDSSLSPQTRRSSFVGRTPREPAPSQPTQAEQSSAQVDSELTTVPTLSHGKAMVAAVALVIAVGLAAWWQVASSRTAAPASPPPTETVAEPAPTQLDLPEPVTTSAETAAQEKPDPLEPTPASVSPPPGAEEAGQEPPEDPAPDPVVKLADETSVQTRQAAARTPAKSEPSSRSAKPRGASSRSRRPEERSGAKAPKLLTEW